MRKRCNSEQVALQDAIRVADASEIATLGNALWESHEEFRQLAEAMPQLVWSADPQGKVDYFNAQWIQYTGVTVELARTKDFISVVHPEHIPETQKLWAQAIKCGRAFEMEYRLRGIRDGGYKWFIARAMPILDQAGKIIRWVGTATDIDQQKRSAEKLDFVLEAGDLFSTIMSEPEVYDKLAQLATKKFADCCSIACFDNEGQLKTLAFAHTASKQIEAFTRCHDWLPFQLQHELQEVLTHRMPLLLTHGAAEHRLRGDPVERLAMMRRSNVYSSMIIPLALDDKSVYGVITLMSCESGRAFESGDLEVAKMVANRAAAGIQRARAFALERKSSQRLGYIASASEVLFASFDLSQTIDRLVEFVNQDLADFTVVLRLAEDKALQCVAVGHHAGEESTKIFLGQRLFRPEAEAKLVARITEHQSWQDDGYTSLWSGVWDYLSATLKPFEITSSLVIPLYSRGSTYGVLIACYSQLSERTHEDWDRPLFEDIGRRTSIAIENGLVYERERRIAETLQKNLLPPALPCIPGLQFSAQYVPGSKECEIGGDWYDAFELKDGTLVISVGDVMGRGLQAASMMGLVRQAIAVTAMHESDPTSVLDTVDYLFSQYHKNALITVVLAFIDPQRRTIRYANAGHMYPIILRDGQLIELNQSRGLPIGLRSEFSVQQATQYEDIAGVDLLMLYTDGLIEAAANVSSGVGRLHDALTSDAVLRVKDHARFIREVCAVEDSKDDIAILAIRFEQGECWSFNADNARAAHDTRQEFVRYLRAYAQTDDHIPAAELVFGELIGNVVRHAPGPIDVQVDWTKKNPVLHVLDRGQGTIGEAELPADPWSEGGRGLFIIRSISKEVLVERIEGYGNHVAVVLPIERKMSQTNRPGVSSLN